MDQQMDQQMDVDPFNDEEILLWKCFRFLLKHTWLILDRNSTSSMPSLILFFPLNEIMPP
jgi:hypothetical protein